MYIFIYILFPWLIIARITLKEKLTHYNHYKELLRDHVCEEKDKLFFFLDAFPLG